MSDDRQVIYTHLDALLDTRLGTLNQMDPEAAAEIAVHPDYPKRISDDFSVLSERISNDAFIEAYGKRDLSTLQQSFLTAATLTLSKICFQLEEQRLNTPFTSEVEVQVNLYPYVVDAETAFDIESAVASHLPMDVKVSSTFIPLAHLTMDFVKRNYSGMVIYDFGPWLQLHSRELETVKLPQVTVIAPRLHASDQKPLVPGDLGPGTENVDPYEAIARFMSPLLGLEWADPAVFNVIPASVIAQTPTEAP